MSAEQLAALELEHRLAAAEAEINKLKCIIEKAVEFADFIEFHESKYVDNGPEETTVYLQKAREFLTTLADASGEIKKIEILPPEKDCCSMCSDKIKYQTCRACNDDFCKECYEKHYPDYCD